MSKDGDDSLALLTSVQRQLVQKSFQTYAFEAKIRRAKDRDDEHATTAGEVLQQALRTHAASVASLHDDGVPPGEDYRQRRPRKSLGRYQYEDLARMSSALSPDALSYGERALTAADDDGPPSPRLQPKPWPQQPEGRPGIEADGSIRSLVSTGTGDGGSSSRSGGGSGAGDGAIGDGSAAPLRSAPPPGTGVSLKGASWRQRRGDPSPVRRTTSGLGGGGAAAVLHVRGHTRPLASCGSSGVGSGSGGGVEVGRSAQQCVGAPGVDAGAVEAVEVAADRAVAGGGLVLMRRTDSGLRRAEQMLLALRECHASGSAGGAGPHLTLPYLPRPPPPSHPPSSSAATAAAKSMTSWSAFHSHPTSPTIKHRHGSGGAPTRHVIQGTTTTMTAAAAPAPTGGRVQQPPPQPPQHYLHPFPRSRSPHVPPFSRSVDSIPRIPPPPPQQQPAMSPVAEAGRFTTAAGAASQDGFALVPVGRGNGGLSFNVALWQQPLPPPAAALEGCAGGGAGHAGACSMRPTPSSGDGAADATDASPPLHKHHIRFGSATFDGGEPPSGGGGSRRPSPGSAKMATVGGGGGGGGGGAAMLLSMPPDPATEQLFTRISRSTSRTAAPQQRWVQMFDAPLPVSSASTTVFTAASCGASPYAAPGLGSSAAEADAGSAAAAAGGGGGAAVRRHTLSSALSQRPPSAFDATGVGMLPQRPPSFLPQRPPSGAVPLTRSASPSPPVDTGVKLPPIRDPSDGALVFAGPGAATEARVARMAGRVRASLSWSVAEGPAAAAFVQRAQEVAAGGTATATRTAADPLPRPQPPQQRQSDSASQRAGRGGRDRSISTDGELRRKPAGGFPASARVELAGTASADRSGGGGGSSHGGEVGGGGFTTPHTKHRRTATTGNAAGGAYPGGGGGGGRASGGSPSIMTRMRKALGSIWPRSPGGP